MLRILLMLGMRSRVFIYLFIFVQLAVTFCETKKCDTLEQQKIKGSKSEVSFSSCFCVLFASSREIKVMIQMNIFKLCKL